jgi:hypothetical protein
MLTELKDTCLKSCRYRPELKVDSKDSRTCEILWLTVQIRNCDRNQLKLAVGKYHQALLFTSRSNILPELRCCDDKPIAHFRRKSQDPHSQTNCTVLNTNILTPSQARLESLLHLHVY